MAVCKPRSEALEGANPADTWDSQLQNQGTMHVCLFRSVTAAQGHARCTPNPTLLGLPRHGGTYMCRDFWALAASSLEL